MYDLCDWVIARDVRPSLAKAQNACNLLETRVLQDFWEKVRVTFASRRSAGCSMVHGGTWDVYQQRQTARTDLVAKFLAVAGRVVVRPVETREMT